MRGRRKVVGSANSSDAILLPGHKNSSENTYKFARGRAESFIKSRAPPARRASPLSRLGAVGLAESLRDIPPAPGGERAPSALGGMGLGAWSQADKLRGRLGASGRRRRRWRWAFESAPRQVGAGGRARLRFRWARFPRSGARLCIRKGPPPLPLPPPPRVGEYLPLANQFYFIYSTQLELAIVSLLTRCSALWLAGLLAGWLDGA